MSSTPTTSCVASATTRDNSGQSACLEVGWPCIMISVADLPLWAKSLIAPAVVLVTMFAMAGNAFVDLATQKANIAYLDGVAFEDLHKAMVAAEAVTAFPTELSHLS